MQSFVTTVLVFAVAVVASVQAKCKGGCTEPVSSLSKEIGCKPVFAQPGDCCPSHYDCSTLETRDKKKCYFNGRAYKNDEEIDIADACTNDCMCKIRGGQAEFSCLEGCSEGYKPPKPGCFSVYKLNKCEPTGRVCPPLDKLAKCKVGNETYYEGEQWFSNTGKVRCVCGPGYRKPKPPFCKIVNCGAEISFVDKIRNKCAPIFRKSHFCVERFHCLDKRDKIVPNVKGKKSVQKCSYGEKKLNIGDKLIMDDEYLDCKCKIPPFVTCMSSE